jgi:hypothetical protein
MCDPTLKAEPNQAVELTRTQPTGRIGEGSVRGDWVRVAHFSR